MSVQQEYIQWLADIAAETCAEASRHLCAVKEPNTNYLGDDVDRETLRAIERLHARPETAERMSVSQVAQLQELAYWRWTAFEGYGQNDPRAFAWSQRLFMTTSFMRTGWSVSELKDWAIVEIGCGPLGMVEFLPGRRRVGFDPLNRHYDRLFSKVRRGGVEYTDDLESVLAGDAGSFDLGICFNVLDHTVEPRALFDAFMSLIAPGGRFLVQVNTVRDGYARSEAHSQMHPSPFTSEKIASWLAAASDDLSTFLADTPSADNEFFFMGWGSRAVGGEV